MRVTLQQIIARGLTHRCPNCGGRTLFGPPLRWLKVNDRCAKCGLEFEREEGFFLGAMVINYTVTGIPLIPAAVAVATDAVSVPAAVIALAAWCLTFPVAFFRSSKSLWLMTYYLFVPGHLPANQGDAVGP